MSSLLKQSQILITGASSGIGRALAFELGSHAKKITLVARRKDLLDSLKTELLGRYPQLKVETIACDLTKTAQIDQMLSQVGDVDVLINNAGMGDMGLFASSDWSKLEQMLQLNIVALTYLTRKLVEPMLERKRGGILMVGSTAGFQSIPAFGTYCGTKSYVNAFSEALRAETKHYGITVSQLCPGPVATEFEAVAKRSNDFDLPKFMEISAQECARQAIRGFLHGKAVIIPGFLPKVMISLNKIIPIFLYRAVTEQMAKKMKSYEK
jgi:short-subunit dehydrogenase